jgi:branched-chain amino acid transport system ATP-binding protein
VVELSKNFGGVQAVNRFNCTVKKGEIVRIIGPNGAGKTTILNLISNIVPADNGEIYLEGQNLRGKPRWQIARSGIARTFRNIRLFNSLDILNNISVIYNNSSVSGKNAKSEAKRILDEFGWTDPVDISAGSLPYGLQRRVELIRAMALNPKLLMLDEPAAGLNPTEIQELVAYISNINQKYEVGIIIIEHRLEVIMNLCSKIYVLSFGQTIAIGTPDQVQHDAGVIEAYLGTGE